MFIVKHRKIFISISAVFVLLSIFAIATKGLNFGIDFTGGSLLQVQYSSASTTPALADVTKTVESAGAAHPLIQPTGTDGFMIRTQTLTEQQHEAVVSALSKADTKGAVKEVSFDSIGPTIGQELRSKAWIAIATVVIAIILFIAYVFRGVSEPVASWKYGVIAIVALAHDVTIPTGIFAALGYQVNSLFVVALLAILGLSVNDTIVVFDRIRENLRLKVAKEFTETVGVSLKQTFTRSINTSLTIMIVLLTLYFVGPDSTKHFSLAMAAGLFFGTYSSIFLASPLLVVVERWNKREEKGKK